MAAQIIRFPADRVVRSKAMRASANVYFREAVKRHPDNMHAAWALVREYEALEVAVAKMLRGQRKRKAKK